MFTTFTEYCLLPEKKNYIEALCILLKRLSYLWRFKSLVPLFGLNSTEICLIFNETLDFIYQRHPNRLERRNLIFLQPPHLLQIYTDCQHCRAMRRPKTWRYTMLYESRLLNQLLQLTWFNQSLYNCRSLTAEETQLQITWVITKPWEM